MQLNNPNVVSIAQNKTFRSWNGEQINQQKGGEENRLNCLFLWCSHYTGRYVVYVGNTLHIWCCYRYTTLSMSLAANSWSMLTTSKVSSQSVESSSLRVAILSSSIKVGASRKLTDSSLRWLNAPAHPSRWMKRSLLRWTSESRRWISLRWSR